MTSSVSRWLALLVAFCGSAAVFSACGGTPPTGGGPITGGGSDGTNANGSAGTVSGAGTGLGGAATSSGGTNGNAGGSGVQPMAGAGGATPPVAGGANGGTAGDTTGGPAGAAGAVVAAGAGTGGQPDGGASAGGNGGAPATDLEWLPSWATTIQRTEDGNLPPPLGGNTLRQFVWPTVPGSEIRIQLSNEKGSVPVEIQKVHIARALTTNDMANSGGAIDTATDVAFTFGGMANVTIPAGETVWSDAAPFPLEEIKLTAVTMQFGSSIPNEITGHPGARLGSYVVDGDAVLTEGMSGAEIRERWYFINAIEVMAPADSYAIAVLGDSITDGYGVHDQFARWTDFLTLAIQEDPMIADNRSVLNFGMGANNLTSSSADQDAGMLRFDRDVLPRDKIKWLIVFEGVNDINGGAEAETLISAYQGIIQKCRDEGILVYGVPITPNGSAGARATVNDWIRTSGEFDAVIDFDEVIRDPNDVNHLAAMYDNDDLHPNLAGYELLGNTVDLSLFYATAP